MSNNGKIEFQKCFNYKVIYVFTIEDEVHKGLVKIGDATLNTESTIDNLEPNCRELNQAALKRIKSYTNTAGIEPILLHTELAVKEIHKDDGSIEIKAFRDHEVHRVLENSGIKKKKINGTTGKEWYQIDKATAIEAIKAVKMCYANLSNTNASNFTPIIFRPEQKEAIEKTIKQFKNGNRMLWNAKMRFGKTLSALEVIRRCEFKKTLILTHRPVVNDGWYEDFKKIFYDTEYLYGSKSNGYSVDELNKKDTHYVYFASIQDLRGSSMVGGKFSKNEEIFDTIWDLLIVDEAHEGTKTSLGDETIKAILKDDSNETKLLALSGTPFNILEEYDEKSIYTWDYIMEQESKSEWDKNNFGDSNPYDELPEMRIYTYDLGDLLHNTHYITYEDKAFNFHEFFRTWTGDYKVDYAQMPESANVGDFVHERDVLSLLNLMTKKDAKNNYPFSKEEYRELFKHSLWMVPGIKEAKALKNLMLKHPVFGSGQFEIVNVAGSDDEESAEALQSVRNAISSAEKNGTYTITLSCGKLTTGVTVKEWTAVFILAGSYSTSAANYLQTIFRVQSPCNKDGKIKEKAYVFDFAPDRTLKMVSQAVSISTKAGKTTTNDRVILGKFLNYCPVISISGSKMQEYKTDRLLQQLKKAYADKVLKNGFDDSKLYNDELMKLDELDIEKFNQLKGIIGKSKAAEKTNEVDVNKQGLTDEQYEKAEKLKNKKKRELTPEELEFLEELKNKKKERNNAISILRGISIRMPLLIYGADVPYDEEITLDKFIEKVDKSSWEEFMPDGVTKEIFKQFKKYYDEDVFIASGRKIRNVAREADTLEPTERVKKIASLFSNFKNPDKETVLTPWRVVNMHMSGTLGGYDFWNDNHENELKEPRYVDQGKVTDETFNNTSAKILEINSKTGLYPLYVTYSIYRTKCNKYHEEELTFELKKQLWNETLENNVYVICKTPMAKQITKRTLAGYSEAKINAHYFDDLINQMENKKNDFIDKISRATYWKKGTIGKMRFDAIVGNPPYQENDGGNGSSARPLYHYFVETAKKLKPLYISMITPSRWFAGGKGLDNYRLEMLNDNHISKMVDFINAKDCFPGISIGGGVNYFLWDSKHLGNCDFSSVHDGEISSSSRVLNEFPVFVRYNEAVDIIHKVNSLSDRKVSEFVYSRNPFGFSSSYRGNNMQDKNHDIKLYSSKGVSYVKNDDVKINMNIIDKYKIMISKVTSEHAGEPNKSGKFTVLSTIKLLKPGEVCTDSYLIVYATDTEQNALKYLDYAKTKFYRFLLLQSISSINLSKDKFDFIPSIDLTITEKIDDLYLYDKFRLSDNEINYVEQIMNEKG